MESSIRERHLAAKKYIQIVNGVLHGEGKISKHTFDAIRSALENIEDDPLCLLTDINGRCLEAKMGNQTYLLTVQSELLVP
jgi:hypothetical protein